MKQTPKWIPWIVAGLLILLVAYMAGNASGQVDAAHAEERKEYLRGGQAHQKHSHHRFSQRLPVVAGKQRDRFRSEP